MLSPENNRFQSPYPYEFLIYANVHNSLLCDWSVAIELCVTMLFCVAATVTVNTERLEL